MNSTRLNTLPPTLRENARYLVFEIISKNHDAFRPKGWKASNDSETASRQAFEGSLTQKDFDIAEVVDAIWQNSMALFGETGASKFSLWVPYNLYDRKKRRGIVKCAHTSVEEVRSALAAIRQIGNEPVIVHVLGVTGTILSAKKKFFGIVDLKAFSVSKETEKPRAQANGFQKEPINA